jgi:hypothetical protein
MKSFLIKQKYPPQIIFRTTMENEEMISLGKRIVSISQDGFLFICIYNNPKNLSFSYSESSLLDILGQIPLYIKSRFGSISRKTILDNISLIYFFTKTCFNPCILEAFHPSDLMVRVDITEKVSFKNYPQSSLQIAGTINLMCNQSNENIKLKLNIPLDAKIFASNFISNLDEFLDSRNILISRPTSVLETTLL